MSNTTTKTKKRPPILKYLLAIMLAGGVGYAIYADATRPVPVQAATITTGTIEAYVEERARTSVPRIYHVTMPLLGRIYPLEVEEGESVKKGDVVARLEDIDWKEAAISADEMTKAMGSALDAALAEVKASQLRAEFTAWVHERLKKASEAAAVSERERLEAEWQFHDAQVKQEESIANRFMTEAYYAMTKLLPGIVDRNFERTTITSPVDGVILKRHVANEKTMISGDPIIDIGNLDDLQITADVLTDQAVRIAKDDRVEIFGEAIGEMPIYGTVRQVKPEAFTKLSSLGVEQQRVAVEIDFGAGEIEKLQNIGRTLGLNYRVRVRVITDKKDDVLLVPRTALFRGDDGGWQTFFITGENRALRVNVEVGLMNDDVAEIVSGIEKGNRVIVAPESGLEEGARVSFSSE